MWYKQFFKMIILILSKSLYHLIPGVIKKYNPTFLFSKFVE